MAKIYQMLIDGTFHPGVDTGDVINPATGVPFAQYPIADTELIDLAVKAAGAAFPKWSHLLIRDRAKSLIAIANGLQEQLEEFASLLTSEQGKPIADARGEIFGAIFTLRGFAEMDLPPRQLKVSENQRVIEHRAPLGVVAAITPWNAPVQLLANKLGPALLAGNTVVVKPAATTPLTTLLLGEIMAEILPAGVVNIVCDRNDLGGVLTSHPDVAKIAFTGSTATGRKVFGAAVDTFKRITLELGGNDAAIVLDDVSPATAAKRLFDGATANAGQICVAIKRAYVPEAIYDEVCGLLAKHAGAAIVGPGQDPSTQIGPLQNAAQFERVKELLKTAHQEGTVIAGGHALDRPGYFVAPTIVRDCRLDARIVQEEQFGPILPVLAYSDIDEVLNQINSGDYGLAATIWSNDTDRAASIGARIEAGTIWINQHLAFDTMIPFRGHKSSGIGGEMGIEGLHEYTQARIVNAVPLSNI